MGAMKSKLKVERSASTGRAVIKRTANARAGTVEIGSEHEIAPFVAVPDAEIAIKRRFRTRTGWKTRAR